MSEIYWLILTAVTPVVLLGYYIYKKDKLQPEPVSQLLLTFGIGMLSVPLSLCFSVPLEYIFGEADLGEGMAVGAAFKNAFMYAAIPEELAKFILIYLLLRNNRYFDEWVDGIVYATMVGLGFACLENILYLVQAYMETGDWVGTGVMRAIFSVPGHFFFAVVMGYFYSLYRFGQPSEKQKWLAYTFIFPMIAHGIYDFILMVSPGDVNADLGFALFVVFVVFFIILRKKSLALIKKQLLADSDRFTTPENVTPPPFYGDDTTPGNQSNQQPPSYNG